MMIFRPGQRLVIPGVQVMQPRPSAGGSGVLLTNLISFWELEEASGTRNDSHGTNHLTDNNTVTQTTGKVGNAAQFTAANSEYFSIADNASLSTGDGLYSIAAWCYLASKTAGRMIASKMNFSGTQTEYALYYDNGPDRFRFGVNSSTAASFQSAINATALGSPSTATWYFVVAWIDGTNANIQINDGTIDSVSHPYATGRDSAEIFNIGNFGGTGGLYWDGLIDQLGFWKRVLTSDERTFLYNSGNGRSYAQIAAY